MRRFLFNLTCAFCAVGGIAGVVAILIGVGDYVSARFGVGWASAFMVVWLSFVIGSFATLVEWSEKSDGR